MNFAKFLKTLFYKTALGDCFYKLGYIWVFKIMIGYHNLIFLISVVLSLVFFLFCFFVCLELKTTEV